MSAIDNVSDDGDLKHRSDNEDNEVEIGTRFKTTAEELDM